VILPDTSVWVEYLRASPGASPAGAAAAAAELDEAISAEHVATCGPVVAELLAGVRAAQQQELARQLAAQPFIDLRRSDWIHVGHTAALLRERGHTTPLIDVQIAVCAASADAELWTLDRDFERIAAASPELRVRVFA
jgi:predicted nucleic acid-binding protein